MKITLDLDLDEIAGLLGIAAFEKPSLQDDNVTKRTIKEIVTDRAYKEVATRVGYWSDDPGNVEWDVAKANGWALGQMSRYKF